VTKEFGWEVTVATQASAVPRSKGGEELLKKLRKELCVFRFPSIWIKPSPRFFPSTDGQLSEAFYYALVTIKHMRRSPPSIVLVSGPPFDNFTLARLVARYFRVPLVLDYRDEWSDSPFDFVKKGKHDQIYERRALDAARLAIFTTYSQMERNRHSFGEKPERAIIPNGWDDEVFSSQSWDNGKSSGLITIRYIGNLGLHVEPTSFFSVLAQAYEMEPKLIGKLRFRFIGSADEGLKQFINALNLDDLVSFDKAVPQSEVSRLLAESDALLILYPHIMARYIPGKFYEYMYSGRPILVFGEDGEVPALVKYLGAGICASGILPQSLIEAVEKISNSSASAFQTTGRKEWIEHHSRSEGARKIMEKLEQISLCPGDHA
jgi:hypothetical protein